MLIGTLSVFMNYAQGMMEPVQWLVQVISSLVNVQVNVERFTKLMETESDVRDTPEVTEKYGDAFHPKKETGSRSTAISSSRTSPSATPTAAKMCWSTLTSRSRRVRTSPSSARPARANPRS